MRAQFDPLRMDELATRVQDGPAHGWDCKYDFGSTPGDYDIRRRRRRQLQTSDFFLNAFRSGSPCCAILQMEVWLEDTDAVCTCASGSRGSAEPPAAGAGGVSISVHALRSRTSSRMGNSVSKYSSLSYSHAD